MKRHFLYTVAGLAVAALLGSPWAQAQPGPSGAQSTRPVPPGSGTGFYSRSFRAPGFSPIPSPPPYNAVSFYGRSYNVRGFSPVPSPPSYNAVSFYGRSYNPRGFAPVPAGPLVVVINNNGSNYPGSPPADQGGPVEGMSYGWHYGPSVLSVFRAGVYSDFDSYALGAAPPG